jgi:hypothetical protein
MYARRLSGATGRQRLPMRPSGCGIVGGIEEAARVDYVAFLS